MSSETKIALAATVGLVIVLFWLFNPDPEGENACLAKHSYQTCVEALYK